MPFRPAKSRSGQPFAFTRLPALRLAALASISLFTLPSAQAVTTTWTGGNSATDNNWSDSGNWSSGVPGITTGPFVNTDLAIFSGTPTSLTPNLDASYNVGSVMFGATVATGAFTLSATNGSSLILSGVSANPTAPTATSAGGNQIVNNTGAPAAAGAQYEVISAPITLANTSGTATGSGQFFFAANGGSTTTGVTSTSFLRLNGNVTGSASTGNTSTLTLYGGNNTRGLGFNEINGIIGDGANGGTLALAFQQGNQFGTNGSTTWSLSDANTYSGGTLINTTGFAGTLRVGNSTALGTGTVTWTASGGNSNSLSFGAANLNIANNQTITSGTALFDTSSNSATLSGVISGGTIQKNGGNNLTLTGTNTYSGGTNVNGGTLIVGNSVNPSANLGTGLVALNGGTLQLQGQGGAVTSFYTTNAITFNGGTIFVNDGLQHIGENAAATAFSTITVGSAGGTINTQYTNKDAILDGVLTGSGALLLQDVSDGFGNISTTRVTNASNTYSGTITLNESAGNGVMLLIGNNSALTSATINPNGNKTGVTSTVVFAAGVNAPVIGALTGAGNITLADQASTPAAVTLTAGGSNSSTTYSGVLSGAGGLTKAGTGTMTLGGANTFTGATTVSGGTLTLNVANTLAATSGITVGSGAVLSLATANALATPGATTSTTAGSPVSVAGQVPISLGGGTLLRTGTGVSLGSQSGTTGTVGIGMLTLTAASTIDYGTTGVGTLNFNSFSDSGNFVLAVTDFTHPTSGTGTDGTDDRLIFNQNMSSFLGDFTINGSPVSQIALGNGEYELTTAAVPEPSTWVAGLLGFAAMGYRLRRRLGGVFAGRRAA